MNDNNATKFQVGANEFATLAPLIQMKNISNHHPKVTPRVPNHPPWFGYTQQ